MCSLEKRITVPSLSLQTRSSVRECLSPLKMKDDNSALFKMLSHISFLARPNMTRAHLRSNTWLHLLRHHCRDHAPACVGLIASRCQCSCLKQEQASAGAPAPCSCFPKSLPTGKPASSWNKSVWSLHLYHYALLLCPTPLTGEVT